MKRAQIADRLADENLRHNVARFLGRGKDLGQREFFIRREEPVLDKHLLELQDGRPVHPQVGIAPKPQLRILAEVLVADVHSPCEADASVDDQDFPMAPQVHRPAMHESPPRQEGRDENPRLAHRPQEMPPQRNRSDAVI